MSSLDKLIGKIEKAQSAVKSFKGTLSKFQNLNFNSLVDSLGEQKSKANDILDARRRSLEKSLSARNTSKAACKGHPDVDSVDLYYPQELLSLENFITFSTRKRVNRGKGGDGFVSRSGIAGVEDTVAIHLYVPDTLLSQSNVQYKNEGVGAIQNVIAGLITDPTNAMAKKDGGMLKDVALKYVGKMADGMTGGAVTAKAGVAFNPMKEMMFDGIGFRSWNFTYEFYPKSETEAMMVNHIIYSFRTAMLPDSFRAALDADKQTETSLQDSFFNYPNVFDIKLQGPVGDKVDGFLPSVCTKCDVDHTGGQKFSVYEDGQPIKTTMTLEFQEIRLLTQQNYQAVSPVSNKDGSLKSNDSSIIENPIPWSEMRAGYVEMGEKIKGAFGGGDS